MQTSQWKPRVSSYIPGIWFSNSPSHNVVVLNQKFHFTWGVSVSRKATLSFYDIILHFTFPDFITIHFGINLCSLRSTCITIWQQTRVVVCDFRQSALTKLRYAPRISIIQWWAGRCIRPLVLLHRACCVAARIRYVNKRLKTTALRTELDPLRCEWRLAYHCTACRLL